VEYSPLLEICSPFLLTPARRPALLWLLFFRVFVALDTSEAGQYADYESVLKLE